MERQDLTLEELVESAEALLAELVPSQSRYRVTARPDARTVRYYTSQSLLPKPIDYAGGRARYGGSHLLRLLAIKKMQSEHHTLRRIKGVLSETNDQTLRKQFWPGWLATAEAKTSRSVQRAARASSIRRFTVGGGATVDVPASQLDDPEARRELSRALATLARRLDDDDI